MLNIRTKVLRDCAGSERNFERPSLRRSPAFLCLSAFLLVASQLSVNTAIGNPLDSDANRHDPGPPRNLAPPGVKSKLVIVGSGMPNPTPYRLGPASAVVVNDTPYLFDAGEGVWRGLAKAASFHGGEIARAFQIDKLNRLFITHMHPDHTVGIPALGMLSWYLGRTVPIDIYGPKGIARRVDLILEAWRDTIEMDRANDYDATPNDWNLQGWKLRGIDLAVAQSDVVYEDSNVKVEAFNHTHFVIEYNYAYRVTTKDRVFVIGGDGVGDDRLIAAAMNADVFVMEVSTEDDLINAPWGGNTLEEKSQFIWRFHTKPRDLARIATAANVKTLVLYHVQNYSDPYDGDAVLKEVRQFYSGDVVQARDGDIF